MKGEKVASFERRREHGAPKDKRWHSKKFLCEIREDFAEIQNGVLAQNGYSVRVDHRSLKAQKMDAEQKGDDFLAGIFDRVPETYVGITFSHSTNENVVDVKRYRKRCQQKQSELFQSDLQEKIAFEFAVKEVMRRAEADAFSLAQSEKFNLKMLLKELRQPSDKQSENLKAYNEIKFGINEKILSLENSMVELKAGLKNTDEKFKAAYCRKNIQFATHNIMQRNLEILNELKETSEKLFCNVQEFKNLSEKKEPPKIIFTLAEVEENLCQQCRSLKVEYEKSVDKKNALMWKVINPTRAISMAKNIFVCGGFKKLRFAKNRLERLKENCPQKLKF